MFDTLSTEADPELLAWLAGELRPGWMDEPRCPDDAAEPAADRLAELLANAPANRPTAALAELDARQLSAAAQVDLLELLQQQQNWLAAATARALAAIEATDRSGQNLSQELVSLALRIPLITAQNKLKTAHSLVHDLPVTIKLLEQGRISARHAEAATQMSWRLPPEHLPAFEARIAQRAPDQTLPRFRQALRRAAIALDPATAEQRHQRAAADRRVVFQPVEDGMAELQVLLPAPQAQSMFSRLTAAARLLPSEDPRSMDQKRADLLVDAVLSGLPIDALPTSSGLRPCIQITVSADTLLGLDDAPAELAGYGTITADTARRLAADQSGTWRRLLTDPDTGGLLDIGQFRYRPSRRLKDFVIARDSRCVFPTCNQPGYRCDYEHIRPFRQGGRTTRGNGAPACRRHNNCKINTGWRYQRDPDGGYTWRTATGHRYRSHPPDLPVPMRRAPYAEGGDLMPSGIGTQPPGISGSTRQAGCG
jgi:hypothetical protein